MNVLDFGCGMGFLAIAAAQLLGDTGQVVAVDLQQQMLDVLRKRADRAGVGQRIRTHRCEADALNLDGRFDFAFAFYSAHEVPDQRRLLREIHALLRDEAKFLLVEPIGHVTARAFAQTLNDAAELGWTVQSQRPKVRWSHAAVLVKRGQGG
jgi:ubiquinone/menaquinone biosynthesis C-methylase UbiE